MLQTLDATATAARLPYVALADAIAQVLRDARAGVPRRRRGWCRCPGRAACC